VGRLTRPPPPHRVLKAPPLPLSSDIRLHPSCLPTLQRILLVAFTLGLAVSISLSELAVAALAVVLLLGSRDTLARLRWPLLVPLLAFAAWTLAAALASGRPLASLMTSKNLLVLATFYVVLNTLPDAAAARRFATVLFGFVALVAVLAIAQVWACPATPPTWPLLGRLLRKCTRAHAFYSIYMTLAGVLTLVLVATLPRLLRARRQPVWMLPGWIVGVIALGLTYVRGAWIAFAAGALASVVLVSRGVVAALVIVAVVVGTLFGVPGVLDRLHTLGTLQDNTTLDRLAMIEGGVAIVRDHPLLGVGPGGISELYPQYAPAIAMRRHTSHLHNTPLQLAAERGLPGLAAWLAIYVGFFGRALAILRVLPAARADDHALVLGCLIAVAAFLVGGLFEYNFGDTEVLLVACALMALPFVVERDVERSQPA
jgi:O-antigen ligase